METVRLILELLYFASGIAIAIVAAIGLRQLSIAKENARMSAKREAYKIASEQCVFYANEIIPCANKLDDAIKNNKIEFFDKSKVEIKGEKVRLSLPPAKALNNLEKISGEFGETLNKLESFSVYFTSGVAAESVAFSAVGLTFCTSIRRYMPLLLPLVEQNSYQNVMKLFLMWNSRLESEKLLLDKAKLEKELEKIDTKTISPLGN